MTRLMTKLTDLRTHSNRKVTDLVLGLKCKWRRLRDLQNTRLDVVVMLIMSACMLHNLCAGPVDICEDHPLVMRMRTFRQKFLINKSSLNSIFVPPLPMCVVLLCYTKKTTTTNVKI